LYINAPYSTNVGNINSTGNNGFVLTIPAGIIVPTGFVPTGSAGSPEAVCDRSANQVATVFTCSVTSTLTVSQTWVYSLNATGGNMPGTYTADVSLTKPDSNPANDKDDAPVTLINIRDVAVNITASAESVLVGTIFNYTIDM
jgi:hypothetical protein